MKIIFNPDAEFTANMRENVKKKDGYCPCKLDRVEDNICMCKQFRDQIADPDYEGFCHCRLYYKEK